MEIVKKAIISVNGRSEEVEVVIDTGADQTMINEEVLLEIGAPHMANRQVQSMGEFKDVKAEYAAAVEIDGYGFSLFVLGGKKNIIGHDFLQKTKAFIDEEKGTVQFKKNYIEM